MQIRVFSDPDNLADVAAKEIAGWLSLDLPSPTLGLAGEGVLGFAYERLRRHRVPWTRVHAWITDQRFVPEGDPESSSLIARRALLDHVKATFHTVPWAEDPHAAAAAYEQALEQCLPRGSDGLQPGLVMLGVGEDGHTASLFPGTEALDEERRGFVANWVPQLESWRLTATIPLLAAARRNMFVVCGADKAGIVAQILSGESDCPAALVSRAARDPVWLLDRDAASLLPLPGTDH
jgi:6-phosphogluconolactonase